MATRKCSTSVQQVLDVPRCTRQSEIPKNAREAVLRGVDLLEGSFTADDTFVGPNTIIRRGNIQPDGAQVEIPYTARITFGKPRRVGAARAFCGQSRGGVS